MSSSNRFPLNNNRAENYTNKNRNRYNLKNYINSNNNNQ